MVDSRLLRQEWDPWRLEYRKHHDLEQHRASRNGVVRTTSRRLGLGLGDLFANSCSSLSDAGHLGRRNPKLSMVKLDGPRPLIKNF